jgi:hypothetical protein
LTMAAAGERRQSVLPGGSGHATAPPPSS